MRARKRQAHYDPVAFGHLVLDHTLGMSKGGQILGYELFDARGAVDDCPVLRVADIVRGKNLVDDVQFPLAKDLVGDPPDSGLVGFD
jgi:hypothetical protein